MIEGLPWPVWTGVLGASVMLNVWFVSLIYRGRMYPGRMYDDKAHEADEWRAESRLKDKQLAEKDKQLGHLAPVGETVNAVMRAIQRGPKDEVPE